MRRLLWLLLTLVLAAPGSLWAQVAYDNSTTTTDFDPGVTVTTGAFTISAAANRAALVGIVAFEALTVSSVTVGGQAGTLISGSTGNDGVFYLSLWVVIAPAAGSQTGSVTFTTDPASSIGLAVLTATGVDQATPTSGGNFQTATASPASLIVTSPANDLSVTLAIASNAGSDHTSNQTKRVTDMGSMDTKTTVGGANPTHTWTKASESLTISAANLKATGAGVAAAPTLTLLGVGP